MTALAAGDLRTVIPAALVLVAFYGITAAHNLSETDDVYAFAYRAEHIPIDHVSDPRLLLYHVLMRLLYLASVGLGFPISALGLMRGVSAICAAMSLILVVRILVRDLKTDPVPAAIAAATLGVSYGFWRYAAEADVYVFAIMLCALVFHLLMRADARDGARWTAVVPIAVLSGVAVLFYQPNVIALFFAFPLLYLRRNRLSWLVAYGLVGTSVAFVGYLVAFRAYWPEPLSVESFVAFLSQRAHEFIVSPLSLRTFVVSVIKSGFAFSHDIVSANWLFGFEWVTRLIQRVFSNNVLMEEVFLARRAGYWIYVPLLILPIMTAVLIRAIWVARPLPWHRLKERRLVLCVAWLVLSAAVIGRLNPAGIEAWIVVLLPLLLLTGPMLFEPAWRAGRGGLMAVLVGLLLVHNAVGGMALVHSKENEFDRVKGAWVIAYGRSEDLILVVENAGLAETLRYRSNAQIALIRSMSAPRIARAVLDGEWHENEVWTYGRDFGGQALERLMRETVKEGGRLLLFDEFFHDAVAKSYLSEAELDIRQSDLERFRSLAEQAHVDEELGATWIVSQDQLQARMQKYDAVPLDKSESQP